MSGFDDNPFADPHQQPAAAKPAAVDEDNPFADPSVTKATGGGAPPAATLDDYNPFDKTKAPTTGGSEPAVMNTDPPAYTSSGAQQQPQVTTADFQELQRRQEELEARARELERREAELRNTPYNARANNWPPIPSFCPFQPCFYQDINVDIPVEFQKIVRYLYYLWLAHIGVLLANVTVGLFYMFSGGGVSTFALALFYFVIFTPTSFVCWFRPAYKAFRDDSSINFMVFFFIFFFQFLMSVLYALGIAPGSCGLYLGIPAVSGGSGGGQIFVGILILLVAVAFAALALADFYMIARVHKVYRSTGASMAKAQAEFTSGVMKNETVRQAAADAAQASARNAFQQATGQGQQQQNGNRF